MKFLAFVLGTFLLTHQAHADVINCHIAEHSRELLIRVFAAGGGYRFEALNELGSVTIYQKTGEIEREYMNGKPMMIFNSPSIRVFHVFGAYVFEDSDLNAQIQISDRNCALNPSEGLNEN